ncbi:hypothetical protein GE09DRAFT_1235790 [Coniochaeta sp. 2T2.1]|nr:hypothetical protein GE09DRAFT_1235790 [Coniochaeta sp. 2T2.1]
MDAAEPAAGSGTASSTFQELRQEQVKAENEHRKVAACLVCRRSKVKCERGPVGDRCRRCIQLHTECERPAFHVGRRKGVKNKRTGLDKALYQVEEALRQVSQNAHSIDATRAVSELKALLQNSPQGGQQRQHSSGGIADRKRRHVTASVESHDQESSSETEDPADSPQSENSARQVSSPVSSSRNPREESLAVDDAENPLQLLARASNLHLSPPSSDHAASGATGSGSLQTLLNHNNKDIAEIERFFNSTQFALDTDADMDPINLGLLSEEEADALFAFFHQNLSHTRWGLDPLLYTASFTRARSLFLFTSITAMSALFMPSAGALSRRLSNHCKTLANRVIATRCRSVEIVLAFMINVPWMFPGKHSADDDTCWYVSMAATISIDLSLHKTLMPLDSHNADPPVNVSRADCIDPRAALALDGFHEVDPASELGRRLLRRRERTWIALFVLERGMCLARGRTYTIPHTPIIKACDRWHISDIADSMDGHLVSMAVLRRDLDKLFATIRSLCDEALDSRNNGSAIAHSIQLTIEQFFERWHANWGHSIGTGPESRLPPYVQILVTHTRLSIYGSVINHPTASTEVRHFFRAAGLSSALHVMRAAIRGESELKSMPNNTAIMVSFAACFALRLSSQFASNPNLAQSVRTLIEETADVLERIGSVTLHRNGISTLYGKYLRHIVRKAAIGTETITPSGRAAAVDPLQSQVNSAFQQLTSGGGAGGHVNQAQALLQDPVVSQPYMEPSPWAEQSFQFSAMSDDQVMEALSRVGNEFDPSGGGGFGGLGGVGGSSFPWEDTATLDWMDWSNLPEYRI